MALFPFLKNLKEENTPEIKEFFWNCKPEMKRILSLLDRWNASVQEKVTFFEFAIQTIGQDVQCQHLAKPFYVENANQSLVQALFPIELAMDSEQRKEKFLLDEKIIITIPYDLKKIMGAIRDIDSEGFLPRSHDNIEGFFVPEFNAVFLLNGRHHVAVSKVKNKPCYADVDVYPLEKAFSVMSVSSDSRYWVINDRQFKIVDPRIAFMYEMAKEIFELKGAVEQENHP